MSERLDLKYGDVIINHNASDRNSRKKGIFIRRTYKALECTDMKGDVWKISTSCGKDGTLSKDGNIIEQAEKAERYERALEDINERINRFDDDDDTSKVIYVETAIQTALEDEDE